MRTVIAVTPEKPRETNREGNRSKLLQVNIALDREIQKTKEQKEENAGSDQAKRFLC